MVFHQIAEVYFLASIPIDDVEIKFALWHKIGNNNIKSDESLKATLFQESDKILILKIELYGIFDKGFWDAQSHPEMERIVKDIIEQVIDGLIVQVKITKVIREVK